VKCPLFSSGFSPSRLSNFHKEVEPAILAELKLWKPAWKAIFPKELPGAGIKRGNHPEGKALLLGLIAASLV
jgi:hypothetical protein